MNNNCIISTSSSKLLPNLFWTTLPTCLPTFVLPVKETREIFSSSAIACPISAPPVTILQIAPGKLFLSKTRSRIFVNAILKSGVEGAPFQILVLPQTIEIALFQPKTAAGKLKALIIPTLPSGFHASNI